MVAAGDIYMLEHGEDGLKAVSYYTLPAREQDK